MNFTLPYKNVRYLHMCKQCVPGHFSGVKVQGYSHPQLNHLSSTTANTVCHCVYNLVEPWKTALVCQLPCFLIFFSQVWKSVEWFHRVWSEEIPTQKPDHQKWPLLHLITIVDHHKEIRRVFIFIYKSSNCILVPYKYTMRSTHN